MTTRSCSITVRVFGDDQMAVVEETGRENSWLSIVELPEPGPMFERLSNFLREENLTVSAFPVLAAARPRAGPTSGLRQAVAPGAFDEKSPIRDLVFARPAVARRKAA